MASSKKDSKPARPTVADVDLLADAYRRWGYLQADIDSLNRLAPYEHPDIAEMSAVADPEAVAKWRQVYCGPIGVEFMHMTDRERCRWVAEWMETDHPLPDDRSMLESLARSELFERFLHKRYVGSKRYSIEGVAGVIPLIESIFDGFAENGGELVMLAMSHRGRLNVLTNIVDVPPADIFAGMEDVDPRSVLGSGDVKYHLGATGKHTTAAGHTVEVRMASNPSHLEVIDPVMMGRVRARQDRAGDGSRRRIIGLTLHGDAAFAGQGVVGETLNISHLGGYDTGGTIRIVDNNLIGFTTDYPRLHTSRHSSDAAKRIPVPIVHVNGEDPRAIWRAGRFATEYRTAFGDDVIVDFIGYRRYGHSEVEDPSITQPLLYKIIEERPMLWEMFAERIGETPEGIESLRDRIWK
ncbi:MAG: thiamine pyrophosphate-dependent enzyme, partial [bacterium]